ncbi:S49 family peptidase [Paraburkholderia sp. PREW-6R]|uniref:S49 family peptidase n=1 Tax=Paraburkholderia sp. PREW-6R TaxID=3141544 RepID=UPI0031F53CEF
MTPSGETLEGSAIAGSLTAYDASRGYRAYDVQNGIAIIPVDGTLVHKNASLDPVSGMQGYDGIEAKLAGAMADPDVRGIMLDINSPGGEVSGVNDLAAKIASSAKPVWAHANELAASAAYWLASAADRVIVTETAEVGSIGVLVAHADYSEQLKDEGVKVTLIHAGANKVDGNPYEPLPAAVRDEWQAEIENLRALFASSVAAGRGIDVQTVLNTEARTYRGSAAVSAGLADAVMPFSDALNVFSTQLSRPGGTQGSVRMNMPNAGAPAPAQDMISASEAMRLAEEARAEGMRAGAETERARISAILEHAEAADRSAQARTLALTPGMTPETAASLLATFPKTAATGRSLAELAVAAGVEAEAEGRGTVDPKRARIQGASALWKSHGKRA